MRLSLFLKIRKLLVSNEPIDDFTTKDDGAASCWSRVGWFTVSQYDYGSNELKSDKNLYPQMAFRAKILWLTPRELVEPIKPIVYYIDLLHQKKIHQARYRRMAKPFETAGFKKRYYCERPTNERRSIFFSPEDIRYSVRNTLRTRKCNWSKCFWPRTGDYWGDDIIWYHNHLRSYRNRYLLETGANPSARLNTSEEEMGEMILL
jgi:hypothetical protein